MEVKTVSLESLKTEENLILAVERYQALSEEISRLELSKKIAREALLEKFKEMRLRVYDTPSGLRCRVDTRKGADYINTREARQLLDEDTYNKLVHEGAVIVTLSVRSVKAEGEK